MKRLKFILLAGLLLAGGNAWAEKVEGIILTSGDATRQFVINEVKEITFGDAGLTVVKTDEATVEFAGDWQMRFCEVEASGISFVEVGGRDDKAQVFNAEGKLVKEVRLSELRVDELPKGVYFIKSNGKAFKRFK